MNIIVSYTTDPYAFAVDEFSIEWTKLRIYAFPPFSIIGRVSQKVAEMAEGILIAPLSTT